MGLFTSLQTSRPAANPQGHQVQQALGPFLGLTQVILSKPQAEYHPMWGRHLTSLILPVLPLALAAETVPDLGLSSLEASRFKDRTIAPGWGRRSQMLSVCPEQDRQIPAQFTVSEIPIIRGVQWGSGFDSKLLPLASENTSLTHVLELSHWEHSKCDRQKSGERRGAHMVDTVEPVGCWCFLQSCPV